ncbi:MAG: HTH-type transcriptional regulator NimR [Pseudomonas citronellolis]|nr:MAG: HTH-type transcriptional regulator NimR [Pseudomonas citronellolis]
MTSTQHLPVFQRPNEWLRPLSREYPDGHRLPEHWHEGAQLVYAPSGVMELRCADSLWVISPQQALWLPAHLPHQLRARGPVALRTLYLHPQVCPAQAPGSPQSLVVTPLLRELLLSAEPVHADTPHDERAWHLFQLLLDELRWAQGIDLSLGMPADARLQKLCSALLQHPEDARSLEDWGRQVGAAPRTLSRLFRAELGTTFILWRQQARIFAALPRLGQGQSVTRVASELGYDSAGAFATAFRRVMGRSPSAFRRSASQGQD